MKREPRAGRSFAVGLIAVALGATACWGARPAVGGGQNVKANPSRPINAADVLLAPGYVIEPVAAGFTFPSGMAFDDQGTMYVLEAGYSYGDVHMMARLVAVAPDGRKRVVAESDNGPWTGVAYKNGAFFVAEGGEQRGGRILRITPQGQVTALVENLPSLGDHHTNGPAVSDDGFVYFGQGTATNSGIVGEDNAKFGWLKRHPQFHDIACRDVKLFGENYKAKDGEGKEVETGAFQPFGKKTEKGEIVKGAVPCSGAVMRVPVNGGQPELVAWGLRNPFGFAFAPDGQLYVTENGFDMRGSRKVFGAPDVLWKIKPNTWYGWPDYAAGMKVATRRFEPPAEGNVRSLVAEPPNEPPGPIAQLAVHSSSNGLDFSRNPQFGHVGDAFIAQFGDMTPDTGKVLGPVGFRVVRVDTRTGVVKDFASNRGSKNGPASFLAHGGLERPVAVKFDPSGASLYVVDFGIMTTSSKGPTPVKDTGMVWRIRRAEGAR